MEFTPKTWVDGPTGGTPVLAADLNRHEQAFANLVALVNGLLGTGGGGAPSVPTGLAAANITSTGFTLSWTASSGNPVEYEVSLNGLVYGTSTGTSLAITGRSASTTYLATVRSRDVGGTWSASSASLSVVTSGGGSGTVAPSVPIGLSFRDVTTTGFTVNWPASTGTPTGYEVFVDGVSVGTPASNTFAVTGRASGSQPSVTVRARNAAGDWSAQSNVLTARTAIAAGVRASATNKVGYLGSASALTVLNVGDATPSGWGASWVTGTLIVAGANVVIDHYRINSDVALTGNSPTVTNSEIRARAVSSICLQRAGGTGVATISDVTVIGQPNGTVPQVNGIWGDEAGIIARRCDVSGSGDGIHLTAMPNVADAQVTQCYIHDQAFVDETQHLDGVQVYSNVSAPSTFRVEHTSVGFTQSTIGTPMNTSVTCGKPPGDQTGPLLTPVLNNNLFGGGAWHIQLGFRTTAAVVTNNDFGPIHTNEFGLVTIFEPASSAVSQWTNNKTDAGTLIPNPNAAGAVTVREVLQTSNDRTTAQTLTTGAGTASGDTIVVLHATDALTLVAAATSNAGTLTQFGTDAFDGDGGAPIRCYTVSVTTNGAKTVTIPASGGNDIFGVVFVIQGAVTAEGFTKLASSYAVNHSTPVATLGGAADLFIAAIMNRSGRTTSFTGSGLAQQANPTATGFSQFAVGSATLTSSGSSPSYTIALSDFAKPGIVVFGLTT